MRKITLERTIACVLLAVATMPLIVFRSQLLFPYVFSKIIFFRSIVEIAAILFLVSLFLARPAETRGEQEQVPSSPRAWWRIRKDPLVVALVAFFFSATISTLGAANAFHAFWGDIERGDGLFSLAHYALFLFLVVSVFKEKDWLSFFKISLVVGAITIWYGWLQYFGVQWFPFALPAQARPGSFVDNPAFFGAYLLLLATIGSIVYSFSRRKSFWRYASLCVAISALITVFITDTRGTLAGLGAGLFFCFIFLLVKMFHGRNERSASAARFKRIFLVCAGIIIAVGIIFFATRQSALWQRIPGVRRLTHFTLEDSSLKTRLLALGSSWEAFKEKPLLGWGPENYGVAYNKYYNPEYAVYEEAWFDRAHNKIAEVAVTHGVFGFAAYMGVLAAMFYALFRFRRDHAGSPLANASPYIAAGIVAYVVQNLFLFDMPEMYLLWYVLVGFVLFSLHTYKTHSASAKTSWVSPRFIFPCATIGIVVLAGFFYFANVIPFYQSSVYLGVLEEKVGQDFLAATPQFLEPYNFLQPRLRLAFAEAVGNSSVLKDPQFDPLVSKAVTALEEVIAREPNYDPKEYIVLVEILNEKAKSNPALFKKSEEYLRHALLLSPKRQDIFYHLSYSLAGQGRFEEGVNVMREAVALSPKVAKAHYNLGIALALAGRSHWDEAEKEFAAAQDIGFVIFLPNDVRNLIVIYKEMLYTYILEKDAARVIRVAERFKKVDSQYEEDMDTIIGFAQGGDWGTLQSFLEL